MLASSSQLITRIDIDAVYSKKFTRIFFSCIRLKDMFAMLQIYNWAMGAKWLSGKVLDSRLRGRGLEPRPVAV